jgi:hypothetical protein
LQLVDAVTQNSQRHRLTDRPITGRQPHPIKRLARIDRDHQIEPGTSLCNQDMATS